MSPSSGPTNTENTIVSDDWNQIIEDSGEEHQQITSISQGHRNVTQSEANNKDALYKTLNKIIQKKKSGYTNIKIPKHNKLNPTPNLAMARNRTKKSLDNQASNLPQTGKMEENNDAIKLEELAKENKLLKAEIQKLLDERSKERKIITNIPTQNRFETLDSTASTSVMQEVEMEAQEPADFAVYLKKKNSQHKTTNNKEKSKHSPKSEEPRKKNIITHSQAKDPQEDPQKTRRKDRPPPINILFQDPRDTTKLLKMNIKDIKDFYIKRVNNGKHILQMDTAENFKQAKELLIKCNSKFYTYTDKTEKFITLLLKGLDSAYQEEEILEELRSLNIRDVNFTKVLRFTTNKSRIDNKILPIFIIQITPESKINNLKKVKFLFHQVIRWEKLMRRDTIQCKKCQRIGHAAANCNLPYRCVKCDTKHKPGECSCSPHGQVDRSNLFCVNCNSYGHPASYRGCPKIIENKKKIVNQKMEDKIKKNKLNSHINKSIVKPNISYADITKNITLTKRNITNYKNPDFQINNTEANEIYNNTQLDEIKNSITKLEKIVENNSLRINTIASLLEKLLNSNA